MDDDRLIVMNLQVAVEISKFQQYMQWVGSLVGQTHAI